jgi:alkylation response protein AidB-like acyl-CoA dehydrogenase
MNFDFTDEQQQLRDTLQRFIRKDYTFDKRRAIVDSVEGFSREVWKQLADIGVLALTLPEEHGGLAGGPADTLVVMEELGRGLVVEPYLATVVLGAGLVARHGSEEQKARILPAVAGGDMLLALAHDEPGGRYELNHVAATAKKAGKTYALSGKKTVVLHGDVADILIVSARTSGRERDEQGISLFIVDARDKGISRHGYPTHDGQHAAEVTLKDAAGELIGAEGAGLALVEHAIEHAIAALCAEAVGNMSTLLEMTIGYLKTRKQFGVPIGSFQALQHRTVDMLSRLEEARSMSYLAAAKLGLEDTGERRRAIAAAKALVGQSARFVGQQSVQLHGGIGVTDEYAAGHYFKRLTLINATFGDAEHHLARFSTLMGA